MEEVNDRATLVLPNGVSPREHLRGGVPEDVFIYNESGLPNDLVQEAVVDTFTESAGMAWGATSTFQTYAAEGNLLARRQYQTPANVVDEIKLARDLAERDDDIAATMGQMVAAAFEGGMANHHPDEKTVALFNKMSKSANLDRVLAEMYRELLISSQISTATLFTRENIEFSMPGSETLQTESVSAPLIGVLPAEQIRVIGNDIFGTADLAYVPDNDSLRRWLEEYFNPRTTPARKAQMGREDRVAAALFVGVIELSNEELLDPRELPVTGGRLYKLNPRMVKRTTFPKGAAKYPRPLLTRNFALLEAKRLLNIMDYALLQGASNYIVVAKKGTDDHPARGHEVANLEQVVRRASKTGVIVGDHRLDFEIITPKLDELLNAEKRRLIGRKMAMGMLRLSEHGDEEGGSEGIKADSEMVQRVITYDRRIVLRHVEAHPYEEAVKRNPRLFGQGAPSIWAPKIILQGTQWFTDYILKLRDRGDIPRRWGVEAAGFPWDAAVEERKREIERGDDETMQPGSVPHSSPEAGPQDNNEGRPGGSRDGQGDETRPRRRIRQNQGETIKAWFDEEHGRVVRMGEVTERILLDYPEREIGRVTASERSALEAGLTEAEQRGPTLYVPVNPGYETRNEKAIRLREGLSVIVGERTDGPEAIVAKLLCFREPEFSAVTAEETALRWGYPPTQVQTSGNPEFSQGPPREPGDPEPIPGLPAPVNVHVTLPPLPPGASHEDFAALASAVASATGSQAINLHINEPGASGAPTPRVD